MGRLREFNAVNSGHRPGRDDASPMPAPAMSAALHIAVARASPGSRPERRLDGADPEVTGRPRPAATAAQPPPGLAHRWVVWKTTPSATVHKLPRLKPAEPVYDYVCQGRDLQDQSDLGRLRLFPPLWLNRHAVSPGFSRGAVYDCIWSEHELFGGNKVCRAGIRSVGNPALFLGAVSGSRQSDRNLVRHRGDSARHACSGPAVRGPGP